ncbi:hypothetical protein NXS19_004528 [Fusarium pseudograminearum]|nr:hypothetical protein NXS19_004528 [Fusarium pseudograminearum]
MALMSRLTMEQIQVAIPPLGSKNVKAIVEGWKGEQKAQLGQLAIRGYFKLSTYHVIDDRIKRYDTPRVYELHETFPDGTKAWKGVSQKVGIPKTRADIQTHNLAKTALLRNAANAAILNMAATALFDIKTLFNGEFQKYFVKLGISGMYGGAVAGIQARIHHPVFGNGAVVGVVVSSAFGVVGLVNTGDWARFVKNTGLGIVGSAGAWGGSQLGAMVRFSRSDRNCPGGMVGGFCGGLAGRWTAGETTNLAERNDLEVEDLYEKVQERNAKMGLRADPSLTKREVMTDAMATDIATLQENLSDWQQGDPKAFEAFIDGLRKATSS